jgi:hypothetical protein
VGEGVEGGRVGGVGGAGGRGAAACSGQVQGSAPSRSNRTDMGEGERGGGRGQGRGT